MAMIENDKIFQNVCDELIDLAFRKAAEYMASASAKAAAAPPAATAKAKAAGLSDRDLKLIVYTALDFLLAKVKQQCCLVIDGTTYIDPKANATPPGSTYIDPKVQPLPSSGSDESQGQSVTDENQNYDVTCTSAAKPGTVNDDDVTAQSDYVTVTGWLVDMKSGKKHRLLKDSVVTIGRQAKCDVTIDDIKVSRVHLQLIVGAADEQDSVRIKLVSDINKILVNGRVYGQEDQFSAAADNNNKGLLKLSDGDQIKVGSKVFAMRYTRKNRFPSPPKIPAKKQALAQQASEQKKPSPPRVRMAPPVRIALKPVAHSLFEVDFHVSGSNERLSKKHRRKPFRNVVAASRSEVGSNPRRRRGLVGASPAVRHRSKTRLNTRNLYEEQEVHLNRNQAATGAATKKGGGNAAPSRNNNKTKQYVL